MTKPAVPIGTLSTLCAVAALAAIPFLWGCDALLGVQNCTLIGCDTGVTVLFSGAAPTAFEVTLTPAGEAPRVIACENVQAGGCGEAVFFEGVTATRADLEIEWDGGSISRALELEYDRFEPNGPGCGPTCFQARVDVAF
jgi:hypothetical protein